ncbi:MAG: hypothetical protein KJO50_07315 [Bacteroidia bacterium]|nr:hypothetical protein [Bacteroidia bacterium]
MLLLPTMHYFDPPREFQGVTVMMGLPDENQSTSTQSAVEKNESTSESENEKKEKVQPVKVKTTQASNAGRKVDSEITDEKSEVVESKSSTDKTSEVKKEEIRKGPTAEEIARQKAEQEAQKKEAAKSKFGSLFNKNSDTNSTSQGDPLGKPDATALEGLTDAYGKTGEGLDDRGIEYQPKITDNTQKTGRVVVRICVDRSGKVVSSKFTQKGSTTTDAHLIDLAERSASKYRFSKSEIDEQCGNIIIDFKLR